MKRMRLMVLAALLAVGSAVAGENEFNKFTFWDNQNLTLLSTNYSVAVPVESYKPNALTWGIQVAITNASTNSGTCALNWQVSNDQATWFVSSNIVTGLAETNSMEADGKSMYWFTPNLARFLRLQAIIGGSNAYLTVKGVIQ